ncbi:dihydroorotate dehydrogenase electron transfer subunit [Candidatus Peregrinibacteria bacterium]|nr:dihydroorotate dehydrogenase electron transfer subunit [Candidatus Peregrinibacteria bacterium]
MLDNFPHAVRIKKIIKETPLVRSYFFEYPVRAKPGQFVNVWVAGIDEKPMSIAFDDGKNYMLSIAAIGDMTKVLAHKKVGDYIGIRGPYGTHFSWKPGQRIAMLAGGYGAGPLYFAASKAVAQNCHVDFFLGARSKQHLLFSAQIKKLKNTRFLPSTNDGSAGFHGTSVACWAEQIKKGARYARVMTCGPELMMKAVSDIAWKKKIDAQISVERYMKCGFGICGNCCVDDLGITTCQNGTVMPNSVARKIKEFGAYHRDSVGRKHSF